MINTLKYAEIVEEDVATKADLRQLGSDIGAEIKDLKSEVAKLEYRIIIKMSTIVGAMITLAIAVTAAVAKIL